MGDVRRTLCAEELLYSLHLPAVTSTEVATPPPITPVLLSVSPPGSLPAAGQQQLASVHFHNWTWESFKGKDSALSPASSDMSPVPLMSHTAQLGGVDPSQQHLLMIPAAPRRWFYSEVLVSPLESRLKYFHYG